MCGIVGYAGGKRAAPILIESLRRLEYRGYDSAGVATVSDRLELHKSQGMIKDLERDIPELGGTMGISHTRWATHGPPSNENAHPHTDCKGKLALVHNGIIENFQELKEDLEEKGHKFLSETDTEVIAHLLESNYQGDLEKAVRTTVKQLVGSFALGIIHADHPGTVIGVRNESPLIVGIGVDENFIASDVPAILAHTNQIKYLDNGEIVIMDAGSVRITDFEGEIKEHEIKEIEWSLEDAEKGGYEHFMIKEIFDQSKSVHEALRGRFADDFFAGFPAALIQSVKIIACGTSYHAGMVGRYIIEQLGQIPAQVDMASEYRYSNSTGQRPLVIVITQSGETADTLAAAREAKRRGCYTVAITNVVGSSITREVDRTFYIRAGPEISVCATKSFTGQVVALYIIGMYIGKALGTLTPENHQKLESGLRTLPRLVDGVLRDTEPIKKAAEILKDKESVFFIGRNINFPSALEGALKLKEISYIHAEGFPAGELKHGPLALLTPQTPVVAIVSKDHTYDKVIGNIREVSARSAPVIAIANSTDGEIEKFADVVLRFPDTPAIYSPVPVAVVLQLLAYYTACARSCPIDKPRNLAKSVTVE